MERDEFVTMVRRLAMEMKGVEHQDGEFLCGYWCGDEIEDDGCASKNFADRLDETVAVIRVQAGGNW